MTSLVNFFRKVARKLMGHKQKHPPTLNLQSLHEGMARLGPEYMAAWCRFKQEDPTEFDVLSVWLDWEEIFAKNFLTNSVPELPRLRDLLEDIFLHGDERSQNMAATMFLEGIINIVDKANPERKKINFNLGPEASAFIREYSYNAYR